MPATTIASPELRRLRAEDPNLRLIDVRTGGEFETSHIPGSYHIPLDTLAEHATEVSSVDHPVVLVCQSGARAANAEAVLGRAGKTGLYVLDGGMNAWEASGGDVIKGTTERWAMDRQVRLTAGSLVMTGILASLANPKAKWFSAAIAGGLIYSAVSNTCAMANVLGRLPYNRGARCDIDDVLVRLQGPSDGSPNDSGPVSTMEGSR